MKNKVVGLNIILMLLFLISCALFLIFTFRNKENFENDTKYITGITCTGNLNTNTELEKRQSAFNMGLNRYPKSEYNADSIKSPSSVYAQYCDITSYNDILAYKCLKASPATLKGIMQSNNIKHIYETIYIFNEDTLYSYLKSKIEGLKPYENKIKGNVYVCMSQAPYLKYENINTTPPKNEWLDARIDTMDTSKAFNYVKFDDNGREIAETNTSGHGDTSNTISSLYTQILIMFPMYDTNVKQKSTTGAGAEQNMVTFMNLISAYYTHNDLCFVKCNKSSTLNCGCLNMDSVRAETNTRSFAVSTPPYVMDKDKDFPIYTSKCKDHTNKDAISDFSLMYFINPLSNSYQSIIE